jgi:hypothetical protein
LEVIKSAGGTVIFDYHELRWPKWLRDAMEEDYFRTVEQVSFGFPGRGDSFSDDDVVIFNKLPHLKEVILWDTEATTECLSFIPYLSRLESISLCKHSLPRVGGDGSGLAHLQNKRSLLKLQLVNVPRPKDGLLFLRGLKKLEYLNLFGMELKDDDLKEIGSLRSLQHLNLNRTPISNKGLSHLLGLTKLEKLHMSGDKIDADGFATLAKLKSLRILDVWGIAVDNSVADVLCRFSNLQELRLDENKVSGDQMKRIREALLNCKVSGS